TSARRSSVTGTSGRRCRTVSSWPRPQVTSTRRPTEADMTTLAPPAGAERATGPRRGAGEGRWRRRGPLLPALVLAIIVTQLPFLATLAISTLHWNILRPGEQSFAGLANYGIVFTDARLRAAVVNTVVLTVSVVLLSLVVGLVLAVLLDRKFVGRGVARTLLI